MFKKINSLFFTLMMVMSSNCFAMQQNFVLITDEGYAPYTATVIQSLKDLQDSTDKQIAVLTKDVSQQSTKLLENLSDDTFKVFVEPIPEEFLNQSTEFKKKFSVIDKRDDNVLVFTRLCFPEMWQKQVFKHAEVNSFKYFLWIDSDLLILNSLVTLFDECVKKEQTLIGCNLHGHNLKNWSSIQSRTENQLKNSGLYQLAHSMSYISGGVVFWKIAELTEPKQNPFIAQIDPSVEYMTEAYKRFQFINIGLEEFIFTQYLRDNFEEIKYMPIEYNFPANCLVVERLHKDNMCKKDVKQYPSNRYSMGVRVAIKGESVHIVHWDTMAKPWTEEGRKIGYDKDGNPTERKFNEIVDQFNETLNRAWLTIK